MQITDVQSWNHVFYITFSDKSSCRAVAKSRVSGIPRTIRHNLQQQKFTFHGIGLYSYTSARMRILVNEWVYLSVK